MGKISNLKTLVQNRLTGKPLPAMDVIDEYSKICSDDWATGKFDSDDSVSLKDTLGRRIDDWTDELEGDAAEVFVKDQDSVPLFSFDDYHILHLGDVYWNEETLSQDGIFDNGEYNRMPKVSEGIDLEEQYPDFADDYISENDREILRENYTPPEERRYLSIIPDANIDI